MTTEQKSNPFADAKILVAEDQEFNRKIVGAQLGNLGFRSVSFAENGRLAWESILENDYDVILLDINMPEIDGLQLLQRIKADTNYHDVPVIVISSVDEVESIACCIEAGAEDFLHKPFNPIILRARLNACLERKQYLDREASYLNEIKAERQYANSLLGSVLPIEAARELKSKGTFEPKYFENVAVLFCDIVGFTAYCDEHPPEVVVAHLQELIEAFEAITTSHGLIKIKTIGDEFMATAGDLHPLNEPLFAAIKCGLDMIEAARRTTAGWQVRVGVNMGPIIGGIVGKERLQYDVWGDTVNMAARVTALGSPSTLTLTADSWVYVKDNCEGHFFGPIDIKGKGLTRLVECKGLRSTQKAPAA